MKKIIPLVLVVLILAFAGVFFLNNNMAMTTLISQNTDIMAKVYNKGVKGLTKNKKFYFETVTKTYVNGKTEQTRKESVNVVFEGGVATKILAYVEDSLEGDMQVYYVVKEGVPTTYINRTPKGSTTDELIIYNNATSDDVLDLILDAEPVLFALNGVESQSTAKRLTQYVEQDKSQFKNKTMSSFSFSPFGAKYEFSLNETETYIAAIDLFGKLHEITYKSGTDNDYTTVTTSFKKFGKKVSIYWKNENSFKDIVPEAFVPPISPAPVD
jgi:hypothetical protein